MTQTPQSTAEWQPDTPNLMTFVLADQGAVEVPGLGTAWTLEISIAGTPVFQVGQGTKSEIGGGWYAYLTTKAEASSAQPGPRSIRVTHPAIAQQNLEYFVVARDVGSKAIDYYVANSLGGTPLPAVQVWFTAAPDDNANSLWTGTSDFAGLVRDSVGARARLGIGIQYAWKYLAGYTDDQNPHQIDTSVDTPFVGTMTAVPALVDPGGVIPGPVMPGYIYATPDDFQKYWFWDFGDEQHYEQLWPLLRLGASRITAALAASDQLDCPRAGWANDYLRELNIIIAAVMFNSPAVRLSNEQRILYAAYISETIEQIRDGDIQVCADATGKNYPAWEEARYGLTSRNAARIYVDDNV